MTTDAVPQSDRVAASSAPLHPLIAQRWSPRALDPTATLGDDELRALFEAARWAPSWGNSQPARFLVGRRGDATFEALFGTLSRGNRGWAGAAAALVLGVAVARDDEGEPVPYAEYGVALATQNLALQAVAEGLVAHQMSGFDKDAARRAVDLPARLEPVIMVAVGRLAAPGTAAPDLAERDARPRRRHPLGELVFAGEWGRPAF
ncbi:Nitroreductase [Streptoalloteichus tenebrarius]|uniref:Nitroreductase n=1 Tax=Streptoalloteichus tenebrarius (strain ATCC 17920 / DSM 40477 / JCM 4838 / CBS 697.72 / NBRC 16177 / NCIMB 11028 / NRRL B-12390 / A12253. 1 / ISP 5477) TaxID=1933 RepID=A0ABT1HR91_STRSD|nr:nitroreductase family protein [Streptoalloteichus tenebrarius]MCP2258041.1 Nitroreductase [Streptoalloteichus tenebrarius]BFF01712.1 nitroreductase family protein [Streptoalloteichus tenebrarius]